MSKLLHEIVMPEEVYVKYTKGFEILSLRLFWETIRGLCKMFVHREGDNPSSMDGVNDLRDHRSFFEIVMSKIH